MLDFRAGVLRRRAEWVSPAGQEVRVSSVRLVSLAQRAVAAVLYEVEPLDTAARLVVQSELVANEPVAGAAADPRASTPLGAVLRSEQAPLVGCVRCCADHHPLLGRRFVRSVK